jgi:hypothetical protein
MVVVKIRLHEVFVEILLIEIGMSNDGMTVMNRCRAKQKYDIE